MQISLDKFVGRVDGGGRLEFRPEYPQPTPGPGEVLIRVTLAGICATDLELARGYMGFAGIPGHEFVGRIVEVGTPAEIKTLSDRVGNFDFDAALKCISGIASRLSLNLEGK